jgi:putative transposase
MTHGGQEFCPHTRDYKLPADPKLHGADTKFGKTFKALLCRHDVRPRRLNPHSPNMNAFVERGIQSIQLDCLDHFVVRGESHLNHLVAEYVEHSHDERPRQGLDNKLIGPAKAPDEYVPSIRHIAWRQRPA